jgi:hypothetical protein
MPGAIGRWHRQPRVPVEAGTQMLGSIPSPSDIAILPREHT